jgi:protein SCO1/2
MTEHDRPGHGIRVGVVLATLGVLAAVTILVAVVMHAGASLWRTPLAGANAPMDLHIPGPNLASAPQYDSAGSVAEEERLLARYEWIDRSAGVARIPIDTAMRILAGEAPARAAPAGAAAPGTGTPEISKEMRTKPPDESKPAAGEEGAASAAPLAAAEVTQRAGALLPLDTRFTDEGGQEASLARYFGRGPVVLVFGYYRCPNLCSTLMENVLVSLSAASLAALAYDVVGVSIDPRENARDAADKGQAYRATYANLPLHLLTGSAADTKRLARAAGVHYAYDAERHQYAHPLALVVAAPDGRVSRYFAGVQFDPRTLRLALVEAARGRVGTLSDRVFLRCAHFDPKTGRYTVAAMSFVRGGSLVFACGVGVWVWRRRRNRVGSHG